MNKSWLYSQLKTCIVFVFNFVKHLFKQRDVLHIECLVEKMINHIVLIWTRKCNVKQVKYQSLYYLESCRLFGILDLSATETPACF